MTGARRLRRAGVPAASALALLVLAGGAGAQVFTIQDSVVSDPASSVPDPEFDNTGFRMTFNDVTNRLWVARVDSVTGAILPKNGRGVMVDGTVFSGSVSGVSNGPEWAYSQHGAEIVYTDAQGTNPVLAHATLVGTQWQHAPYDSALNRVFPIPSKDSSFADPYLAYLVLTSPTQGLPAWRIANDPGSEAWIPPSNTGSAGRWIDGMHAFSAPGFDSGGVLQAFRYDCDVEQFVQLTFTPGDKEEVWMFPMPEFGGEYLFFCVHRDENALVLYREIGGVWTPINTIKPPARYPYILSPEPFFDQGRSYAVMQCSSTPTQQNSAADIWIASLAPGPLFARAVSDTTGTMVRRDPEPLVITTGPLMYYSEVSGGIQILHRCATGLRTDPPTAVGHRAPGALLALAGASPSRGSVTLRYALETAGRVRLSIADASGREVAVLVDGTVSAGSRVVTWNGRDARGRPAPAGVYFARIDTAEGIRSRRFALLR